MKGVIWIKTRKFEPGEYYFTRYEQGENKIIYPGNKTVKRLRQHAPAVMAVILVFCPLPFIQCQKTTVENAPQLTLNGRWILKCYSDSPGGVKQCRQADQPSIILEFKGDKKEGSFEGVTTANQVGGTYLIGEGGTMQWPAFYGTKMAEVDEWGHKFWMAANDVQSYYLSPDSLVIFYSVDKKAMEFKKIQTE